MRILASQIAAACALLVQCSAHAADLPEILERGTLRVAVSPLAPFVIKGEDGAYTGFEIDATGALAAMLGVEVDYVETPFCSLGDVIVEGQADIVASGYSNIAARRSALAFSLPYHDSEYVLALSKPAAKRARTMRGINRKDISIGYQQGGVSGEVAKAEFAGANLKAFSSFPEIVAALKAGEIDGAVLFSPYDEAATKLKSPRYIIPHEFPLTRTIEAFALQQDAEELRDAINGWIIEKDLEGYWDDLEEKWFDPDQMMMSARPAEQCKSLTPTG
ncbi:MAG: transporter substrate-binding domain-containing protein [Alphaproteobacteria bacterium]|nr:transporter substrate-binding domain-containing protein [Alphaproteobacteria bacterium]